MEIRVNNSDIFINPISSSIENLFNKVDRCPAIITSIPVLTPSNRLSEYTIPIEFCELNNSIYNNKTGNISLDTQNMNRFLTATVNGILDDLKKHPDRPIDDIFQKKSKGEIIFNYYADIMKYLVGKEIMTHPEYVSGGLSSSLDKIHIYGVSGTDDLPSGDKIYITCNAESIESLFKDIDTFPAKLLRVPKFRINVASPMRYCQDFEIFGNVNNDYAGKIGFTNMSDYELNALMMLLGVESSEHLPDKNITVYSRYVPNKFKGQKTNSMKVLGIGSFYRYAVKHMGI